MAVVAPFPTLLANLIFTSSHALNKIQFESLMGKNKLIDTTQPPELFIRLEPHKANRTLSIIDTGIGMTKADLCASRPSTRSGTQKVMALHAGVDVSTTGEFDIGFYAACLTVEKVIVTTKHNDDEQYIWESQPSGPFPITRDDNGEPLGRGTKITLFLKEDQLEYLEEKKITDLVKKHLEFINYPIYLWTEKKTSEQVELEKEEEGDIMEVCYEWQLINKKVKRCEPHKNNSVGHLKAGTMISDWALCKVIKDILGDKVVKVIISPNSFDDSSGCRMIRKRILEINPDSAIVEELRRMVGAERNEENVRVLVLLLFEAAVSTKPKKGRSWAKVLDVLWGVFRVGSAALPCILALSNGGGCVS